MKYQFSNCGKLLEICKKNKLPISQVAIRREMELFGKSKPLVRNKMKEVRNAMWHAIQKGIKTTTKSKYGLVGTSAGKVYAGVKKSGSMLHSKVAIRAMAYALATTEQNARMGRIVAFPTAGGSGVVPGVLFSTFEHMKSSKRKMLNALFTASAIGIAVLEHDGTISAAKAGCQAEVGVGTAMAAAGVTEMREGTPEQCVNAAALALKNMLGLACDPLGGLVEVPCVKRNAIGASIALAASDMSMLGVESFVPMDEVVEAMMNISATMNESIRETALGGLAITPTGFRVREKMGLPPVPKEYLKKTPTKKCGNCKGCN
ncbi:L-serine ammonia-lyase, iron-sulfur-dependent, subunit alpha [Patescibacteria group bacterium]|nr:L-serine ammonia-lyase, iron-sulfur-dependent, subunit alpha [Patescibacteria group bacterium]MBU1016198.1 L-serine ammonia-lyase, iron-sulfur-dependent, subunit alpha [Patescibacteria group bacterium]MBU1684685.1 L-serine ammonia-lyase, iron-sulfur-dependent, subunit alpha [Patescibacteria group bacterium]MBU1938936.1 L-serine ammonia-lyase, iron-sulfur-dependent, subunit alpha [Patescibacteria group bacterium]